MYNLLPYVICGFIGSITSLDLSGILRLFVTTQTGMLGYVLMPDRAKSVA